LIDDDPEHVSPEPEAHRFEAITTAQDWAAVIGRTTSTARARDYEDKARSLIKAGVMNALRNERFADAAALLDKGKSLARASGRLADSSDIARKAFDVISAPDNPWVVFGAVAISLASQLARNHEQEMKAIPEIARSGWKQGRMERKAARNGHPDRKPLFTLHLPFGRKIPVHFRFRLHFPAHAPATRDPEALALSIFSDEKLIRALRKEGIDVSYGPPDFPVRPA